MASQRYTVDIESKDGSFQGYGPSFSSYDEALSRARYVAGLKGYDGELINGGAYINAPSGNIYRVSPDGGVQLWHAGDGGPGPTENVSGVPHSPDSIPPVSGGEHGPDKDYRVNPLTGTLTTASMDAEMPKPTAAQCRAALEKLAAQRYELDLCAEMWNAALAQALAQASA